jgi:hypothetical protein
MEYKIYPVDAKYVIEAVILKARKEKLGKSFSKNDLEKLGISSVYAQNAIKSAEQLNLFSDVDKLLSSTNEEKKIIFRDHLQKYQPFLDFLSFLMEGLSPLDAAKKLKIIYEIERNEKDIIFTFSNFGRYAGIFVDKKGKLELNESVKTVPPTKLVEIVQNLDNELKARLYIRKLLKDVVNDLSSQEIDDLVFSFLNFEKDPKESIRKAGIVLEDFLRTLAKKRDVDVTKAKGIEEIANILRKNGVLASKHINILRGLEALLISDIFSGFSAFRSMPSHGKDRIEEERWELSPELALTYIIQIILTIKSLWYYGIKKQLKF